MNIYEDELVRVILRDIETLNIDLTLDDNKYYYDLIVDNLKDLLNKKYETKYFK